MRNFAIVFTLLSVSLTAFAGDFSNCLPLPDAVQLVRGTFGASDELPLGTTKVRNLYASPTGYDIAMKKFWEAIAENGLEVHPDKAAPKNMAKWTLQDYVDSVTCQ